MERFLLQDTVPHRPTIVCQSGHAGLRTCAVLPTVLCCRAKGARHSGKRLNDELLRTVRLRTLSSCSCQAALLMAWEALNALLVSSSSAASLAFSACHSTKCSTEHRTHLAEAACTANGWTSHVDQ